MKLRPTIFLSGVSSGFASFRDAVETEVQKKGCFPLNQPSFGVDYRTIEEILRRNIGEADAVIHIVGFRFGFEPRDRPSDKPRRSYTQMEYDIARELNKPVYVFLSADASVRDANPGEQPEDAEAVQLQLDHRQCLEQSNNIRYSFQAKTDLCLRAANIPLLATADFRVDISRIDKYAPAELIGRESELKLLDDAWLKVRLAEPKRPHILTFVALGGEGKTSLVAKWLANLAYENWPGCDSAFAWSFYSQGSHEQSAASSDLFLKEAISFFGNDADKEFAASPAGAYEKGQRLARIVGQRRALLILDGLEPLQYAPTSPTAGELKDSGIAALLKGLAADGDGVCIVTTRYSLPTLKVYWQTTAPEIALTRLFLEAGVQLLETLGVKGSTRELETLVEDLEGHALTLNILGTFLRDAHGGDIRRRDLIRLEEADSEEQSGHAFRVMEAYERLFEGEGENGKRALGILRMLGLFDRSVDADCFAALIQEPHIDNLTDSLVGLSEAHRNLSFKRLENAHLITVNREASGDFISLDAHPLLREYFAHKLSTQQPETWRVAHQRLYEYLCSSTPDKEEPTLEDLQPLYQAIAHGCYAGLQQKACDDVFRDRIVRRDDHYSMLRLGAYGSDLGAIAHFFEVPWTVLTTHIIEDAQAWLLIEAAFCLRALGRLTEALEPVQTGLTMLLKHGNQYQAASAACNLSEIELTTGLIEQAIRDAARAVKYSDASGEVIRQVINRTSHADALHQAGLLEEAKNRFREALEKQLELEPEYAFLYSLQGFRERDFILGPVERASWWRTQVDPDDLTVSESSLFTTLDDMFERTMKTFRWYELNDYMRPMDIALEYLTFARVLLYRTALIHPSFQLGEEHSRLNEITENAVEGLRRAGTTHHLPRALLTRSWFRFLASSHRGSQRDLDDAWEIAERGPMRLFMADIHLYRARLFFREDEYPWDSPETDLTAARRLIEQCGYWRRKEELEDAERVILKKSV